MTQTDIPTWCLTLQMKLMAALDATWATLDGADDPAVIRKARDKAKAIGDLAAVARKVALIAPAAHAKPLTNAVAAGLSATQAVANLRAAITAPAAAQAEPARRALDKLKGGRRGRL